MSEKSKDIQAIERIEETIANLKDNKFNIYFFIIDSHNVPNSSLAYIYELAKTLQDKKYNVTMLYQLQGEYTEAELYKKKKKGKQIDPSKVFVGVGDWLGEEYAKIPHMNIAHEQWTVSPSDILFIPEAFSSLMFQTYQYKAPCRRVVLLQNFAYVTDFIPYGVEWKNYGIYDVVATTKKQEDLIKSVFPYVRSKILPPVVPSVFRKPIEPKKLLINIIASDQRITNRIIKTFYWKYPIYKFVSFVDLRNHSREEFAEKLREGAITVWVDNDTQFGHCAVEAIACDNILIGKVPDMIPEWMTNEDGTLNDCGVWTYDINMIPDLLANVIGAWMQDCVPEQLTESMKHVNALYTVDNWNKNVDTIITSIIDEQIKSFEQIKSSIQTKINDNAAEE
jgi:hypothetical protein